MIYKELWLQERFPGDSLISVCTDSYGLIWAITELGIYRFDGLNIIPLQLDDDSDFFSISNVQNRLVLVSSRKILTLDINDFKPIVAYELGQDIKGKISASCHGNDTLLFSQYDSLKGTNTVLLYAPFGTIKEIINFKDSKPTSVLMRYGNTLAVITDELRFVSIKNMNFTLVPNFYNEFPQTSPDRFCFLNQNYFIKLNPSTPYIQRFQTQAGKMDTIQSDNNLEGIFKFNQLVYAAYSSTGIGTFELVGKDKNLQLVLINWKANDQGLPVGYQQSIMHDNKVFWRINNSRMQTITLQKQVFDLIDIQGRKPEHKQSYIRQPYIPVTGKYYYAATYGALLKIDKQTNTQVGEITFSQDGTSNSITASFGCRDSIIVYSLKGIFLMHPENEGYVTLLNQRIIYARFKEQFPHNPDFRFNGFKLVKNGFWVGTKSNLVFYYDLNLRSIVSYEIIKDNIPNARDNLIYEIEERDDESVFLVCKKGIFWKFKNEKEFKPVQGEFKNLRFKHDVTLSSLLFLDNNRIVFSTFSHGLFVYDFKLDSLYQPHHLYPNWLNFSDIWMDGNGIVWGTTTEGLAMFDQKLNVVKIYNEAQGMPAHSIHYRYMGFDVYNNIYLGFENRILKVLTKDLLLKKTESDIYIGNLFVNGEAYQNPLRIWNGFKAHLNSDQNNISFNVFSSNLFDGSTKSFAIRLEGWDSDWRTPSDYQQVSYLNLKPGVYQLQVKSLDAEFSKIYTFDFVIRLPFWKTWWFYTLLVLLVLAIVIAFIQYRLYYLKQSVEIRNEYETRLLKLETESLRAQMNPHFIFNSLNSIKSFIIDNEKVLATQYLNKFSSLIRLILNSTKKPYTELENEILSLKYYVELEELRFRNKFTYSLKVDTILSPNDIFIPPMLIQPYVENAIWHGLLHKETAGKLMIKITETSGFLNVVVEDDGIGRTASKLAGSKSATQHKSMGMDITASRLNLINKNNVGIQITDLFDVDGKPTGTRVELKIAYFNAFGERVKSEL